jgi:glycosyltransferase involved in cell wall biosynthesis
MSLFDRIPSSAAAAVLRLLPQDLRRALYDRIATLVADRIRSDIRDRLKAELRAEIQAELESRVYEEARIDLLRCISLSQVRRRRLAAWIDGFVARLDSRDPSTARLDPDGLWAELRAAVREAAGLRAEPGADAPLTDLLTELAFLYGSADRLAPVFRRLATRRVLFAGQAYYNAWYLSRALRRHGWKADVLNWDPSESAQIHYHGEDFKFQHAGDGVLERMLSFYLDSLYGYDIFHFSNAHGMSFGGHLGALMERHLEPHAEILLIKALGKRIVYTNNGCQDGVSQTSFSRWGPHSVCAICRWREVPTVCSDERNLAWGQFRNAMADYQCLLGDNRVDYNVDPRVHEVPEFYCLDPDLWRPDLEIPEAFRLEAAPGTIRLYHSVGNLKDRTDENGVNIKTTHIWCPLMERLQREGHPVDWLHFSDVPNRDLRFYQVQADIFLDMLTFGWFGATAREAMMLGKPVIGFIRPEWLEGVRQEIPEYAEELPIVSATPETAYEVLKGLVDDPERRAEIGRRSRGFALKWHSAEAGGRRLDAIYRALLDGRPVPSR